MFDQRFSIVTSVWSLVFLLDVSQPKNRFLLTGTRTAAIRAITLLAPIFSRTNPSLTAQVCSRLMSLPYTVR